MVIYEEVYGVSVERRRMIRRVRSGQALYSQRHPRTYKKKHGDCDSQLEIIRHLRRARRGDGGPARGTDGPARGNRWPRKGNRGAGPLPFDCVKPF